jgi:hypothetical protein
MVTARLQIAFADRVLLLIVSSVTTFLMVFGLRLINPTDGPLGKEPEWRGFALQIHDWRAPANHRPEGSRP